MDPPNVHLGGIVGRSLFFSNVLTFCSIKTFSACVECHKTTLMLLSTDRSIGQETMEQHQQQPAVAALLKEYS